MIKIPHFAFVIDIFTLELHSMHIGSALLWICVWKWNGCHGYWGKMQIVRITRANYYQMALGPRFVFPFLNVLINSLMKCLLIRKSHSELANNVRHESIESYNVEICCWSERLIDINLAPRVTILHDAKLRPFRQL